MEDAASTLCHMLLLRLDPSCLKGSALKKKSEDFARNLKYGDLRLIVYLPSFTKCKTIVEIDTLELALALFWAHSGHVICQFIGYTTPVV